MNTYMIGTEKGDTFQVFAETRSFTVALVIQSQYNQAFKSAGKDTRLVVISDQLLAQTHRRYEYIED